MVVRKHALLYGGDRTSTSHIGGRDIAPEASTWHYYGLPFLGVLGPTCKFF